MKRILALLLLLSLLTGCRADQGGSSSQPSGTVSSTAGSIPSQSQTDPTSTDPTVTDPTVTEPTVTEPAVTEPAETDPVVTEPMETEPPVTEPAPTEPPVTEPEPTEPEEMTCDCDPAVDPYEGMSSEEFYASYTPACCYTDACHRTAHYFLSGSLDVPGQYAVDAAYQPMEGDLYVRNTDAIYLDDGNTYVVVDSYGVEVMRIYKGAAYITLEEVAAYIYAFGGSNDTLPANYSSKKSTKPTSSPWGEYLRVNHSYFSGDTAKYPYEPVLPNISGCGGSLRYYELDIGTTGTETPGYAASPYNNGTTITRGAARIVYARQDLNGNGVYEQDEIYVFYTHNHYNDFREYLNYYGGWGQMFGNVTGGGEYSSKTNCNPTPYPQTAYESFSKFLKATA